MKTRATITIEPWVLEKTRGLARKRRTNVSSLIEQLLTREIQSSTSITDTLIGSGELREDPADARLQALRRKHLHG